MSPGSADVAELWMGLENNYNIHANIGLEPKQLGRYNVGEERSEGQEVPQKAENLRCWLAELMLMVRGLLDVDHLNLF